MIRRLIRWLRRTPRHPKPGYVHVVPSMYGVAERLNEYLSQPSTVAVDPGQQADVVQRTSGQVFAEAMAARLV